MVKKILIVLISLFVLAAGAYYNAVYVNTKQITIREEVLKSEQIAKENDGFLIAYFADVDLNAYLKQEQIDSFANTIMSFKPDLILFGGDLLDEDAKNDSASIQGLKTALSKLDAPYGKFAVYGDQDHARHEEVTSILEECGFRILNNESILICNGPSDYFNLVGIDSLSKGSPDPQSAFMGTNAKCYTIAMSHCPDIFDSLLGYHVDQLLSAHSRGGQVYFPLLSSFGRDYGCRKYFKGKTTKSGVTLDITNGIGRKGSNARFLADSEVVFYTLKSLSSEN